METFSNSLSLMGPFNKMLRKLSFLNSTFSDLNYKSDDGPNHTSSPWCPKSRAQCLAHDRRVAKSIL